MKFKRLCLAALMTVVLAAGTCLTASAGPADDPALTGKGTGAQIVTETAAPQVEAPEITGETAGVITEEGQPAGETGESQAAGESEGAAAEATGGAAVSGNPYATVEMARDNAGKVKRIGLTLHDYPGIGGISYSVYLNTYGHMWWDHDGNLLGSDFDGNNIEGIRVVLTGNAEKSYDVYYRVTSTGHGTMGWAKNGEYAGTIDIGETLEGLEVSILPKGSAGPSGGQRYVSAKSGSLHTADGGTTFDGGYTGWLDEDFERYYFDNGVAVTGWQYIGGLKFCFDNYGRLIQDVDSLIGKKDRYLLKVNKELNCLTVYAEEGSGNWIIPVKAMRTSVGDDTPLGTFYTPEKYRWRFMINDTWTQYATRITEGFLFHSITYASTNENDLLTVGYNGLGVSRSHGCVRLTCANAKWVYDNCVLGTEVYIYEDSEVPSPFMKPELIPISMEQTWDPTDPLFQ